MAIRKIINVQTGERITETISAHEIAEEQAWQQAEKTRRDNARRQEIDNFTHPVWETEFGYEVRFCALEGKPAPAWGQYVADKRQAMKDAEGL